MEKQAKSGERTESGIREHIRALPSITSDYDYKSIESSIISTRTIKKTRKQYSITFKKVKAEEYFDLFKKNPERGIRVI